MTARILDISPDEYHLRPGLSASIATTLVTRTPLHAWAEHPTLGNLAPRESTGPMDLGTVVHAITLGKGKRYAAVPYDDYRTNAAKDLRDGIRADGIVPLLHHQLTRAEQIAASIPPQLEAHGIELDGESEVAIEWHEKAPSGPVLCRSMFDHVWFATGVILDLKIVGNAELSQLERSSERFGYAIQAAAYKRALTALHPRHAGRVRFLFAFVESDPPHALNLTEPDGGLREIGEKRWTRAVRTWAECMAKYGAATPWPGYGRNKLSAPAWALAREEI